MQRPYTFGSDTQFVVPPEKVSLKICCDTDFI